MGDLTWKNISWAPALTLVSCIVACSGDGDPKCPPVIDHTLDVDQEVSSQEMLESGVTQAGTDEGCETLCEYFSEEMAREESYIYETVLTCTFTPNSDVPNSGHLACAAEAYEGGCDRDLPNKTGEVSN